MIALSVILLTAIRTLGRCTDSRNDHLKTSLWSKVEESLASAVPSLSTYPNTFSDFTGEKKILQCLNEKKQSVPVQGQLLLVSYDHVEWKKAYLVTGRNPS